MPRRAARPAPIDLLLWVMTFIWGANYAIVKVALVEIPPLAFNALRLVLTSGLLVWAIAVREADRPSRQDLARLVAIGFIGHFIYQLCFIGGLARTSVANSALIIGCTPVTVLLLTAAARHEHVTGWHWAGIGLSVAGMALIVGQGASLTAASLTGDLLLIAAIVCWGIYTVAARPLLGRHSALAVTGYSMAVGAVLFAPFGVPDLLALRWEAVSLGAWAALLFSAIFALGVSYLIWYTAVQRIGNARTAAYSNVVPVVAMVFGTIWLGEALGVRQVLGAAGILGGVALTRWGGVPSDAVPAAK